MNKKVILLMAAVGSTIGAYIPSIFGDNDILSGWSMLGGLVGGIIGIWLGVKIGQRY